MILTRRGLICGVASVLAAPAIVRASSLMPVKVFAPAPLNMTATEVLARLNALGTIRWQELESIWEETAELLVNPPVPTATVIRLKREELLHSLSALLGQR